MPGPGANQPLIGLTLLTLAGCSAADSSPPPEVRKSEFAIAFSAGVDPMGRPAGLQPEERTRFEERFVDNLPDEAVVRSEEIIRPAYNNARGIRLEEGGGLLEDIGVWGRKFGLSLDATDDVLVRNFAFSHRRSMDPYGAGISISEQTPTVGTTYISNVHIDLAEPGPNSDYDIANNEAILIERGSGPVMIRKASLLGAEDAAIDVKSNLEVDASFLASGHRTLRLWEGADVTIANSTILAFPGYSGFWFGSGPSRLRYYNCRFGEVGDDPSELSSDPPDWMISGEEDAQPEIVALDDDPFDRGRNSFWAPTTAPTPAGYLNDGGQ